MVEREVSLNAEVKKFISTDDQVALGNLAIRKDFADRVVILFTISNLFVLLGLGVVFSFDCTQLAAGQIKPGERVVNSQVVMALLGATTVQLGTVVLTIARAIFPSGEAGAGKHKGRASGRRQSSSGEGDPDSD